MSGMSASSSMPSLATVAAPTLMGQVGDCILFGIALSQFIRYFSRSKDQDRWHIKLLVVYISLASIAHLAYVVKWMCDFYGLNTGSWALLFDHLSTTWLMSILIVTPIEVFYAHRAWMLWERHILVAVVLIIACSAEFAVGIATKSMTVIRIRHGQEFGKANRDLWVASICLLCVVDLIISGLILGGLLRHKRRTGFLHTHGVLTRMIILTAEAQLIPSVIVFSMMIKVLVHPADSFGFFFTWTPMAWVVSVMSVINSRTELRQDMENERERQQNTFEHDLSGSPGLSQDIGSTAYTSSPGPSFAKRPPSLLRLQSYSHGERLAPIPPSPECDPDQLDLREMLSLPYLSAPAAELASPTRSGYTAPDSDVESKGEL